MGRNLKGHTMAYDLLRTVEHTYEDGDQSVLGIMKIVFDNTGDSALIIDNVGSEYGSVMIHSSDQLDRLIAALRDVQKNHFDGLDALWAEVVR